ncbi:hypothetical protein PSPO01_16359 [Paraphaeosphaeria sporulosa]
MHFATRSFLSFLTLLHSSQVVAQNINLGTAASYGALGSTAVTNVGNTVMNGVVGVFPGNTITGFPPGTAIAFNAGNALAQKARLDAGNAYQAASGLTQTATLPPVVTGPLIFTPGVYNNPGAVTFGGTIVLDGQGNPNSQFVFQIGGVLATNAGTSILLANGAQACRVFFQVAGAVGLGASTTLNGNIIASLNNVSVRAMRRFAQCATQHKTC